MTALSIWLQESVSSDGKSLGKLTQLEAYVTEIPAKYLSLETIYEFFKRLAEHQKQHDGKLVYMVIK